MAFNLNIRFSEYKLIITDVLILVLLFSSLLLILIFLSSVVFLLQVKYYRERNYRKSWKKKILS